MIKLNCAVLHVNFRGSTGFGQSGIDSLLGNIGDNDVSDVIQAVRTVCGSIDIDSNTGSTEGSTGFFGGLVDPAKVTVVGGSHGGFLAGHLIGQFPDMFRAAALRNPVTNLPAMVTTSDIPDWCYTEGLGAAAYDFSSVTPIAAQSLATLHARSPIAYVQRVRTPTLLLLGMQDRRVPPSQGLEYYHLLKSRKVPVRVLTFPEDMHAIDKPLSEAEQWIAITDWLATYIDVSGKTGRDFEIELVDMKK